MSCNSIGRAGEKLFQQIMESRGYSVQDVTNSPEYWAQDIDFIITSPFSGDTKTFEVKYDSRIKDTNNLYLELLSLNTKNTSGWFEYCKADYLAYGDAANRIFYIIPLLELKQRAKEVRYRECRCGWSSIGQIISLDEIKDITRVL